MKMLMILLACFALYGCTCEPEKPTLIHDVQVVEKPVREPCVNKLPEKPKTHTDAEIKAMPDGEATFALISDRIALEIYQSQAEAILAGCQ